MCVKKYKTYKIIWHFQNDLHDKSTYIGYNYTQNKAGADIIVLPARQTDIIYIHITH